MDKPCLKPVYDEPEFIIHNIWRLACHLAEGATLAEPENCDAHMAHANVYGARRKAEASLMSEDIFGWAERKNAHKADKNSA
jgi:hypothetical protein